MDRREMQWFLGIWQAFDKWIKYRNTRSAIRPWRWIFQPGYMKCPSWFISNTNIFHTKTKSFVSNVFICLCIKLGNWRKLQYLKRARVKLIRCKYTYCNRFTPNTCIWHTQRKTFYFNISLSLYKNRQQTWKLQ